MLDSPDIVVGKVEPPPLPVEVEFHSIKDVDLTRVVKKAKTTEPTRSEFLEALGLAANSTLSESDLRRNLGPKDNLDALVTQAETQLPGVIDVEIPNLRATQIRIGPNRMGTVEYLRINPEGEVSAVAKFEDGKRVIPIAGNPQLEYAIAKALGMNGYGRAGLLRRIYQGEELSDSPLASLITDSKIIGHLISLQDKSAEAVATGEQQEKAKQAKIIGSQLMEEVDYGRGSDGNFQEKEGFDRTAKGVELCKSLLDHPEIFETARYQGALAGYITKLLFFAEDPASPISEMFQKANIGQEEINRLRDIILPPPKSTAKTSED